MINQKKYFSDFCSWELIGIILVTYLKKKTLNFRIWRSKAEDSFGEDLRYLRGFVQLQDLIDRSIIELQTGNPDGIPDVTTKQIPFPCHQEDEYVINLILAVLSLIRFLFSMAFHGMISAHFV